MEDNDIASNAFGVPPLLYMTLEMEESVKVIRSGILRPFPEPGPDATAGDYMDVWDQADKECRQACEEAIRYWLEHRTLPILDDPEAYFLCRRFDQASEFLQNLFLRDQTTVFSCGDSSLHEVLWWTLVDWWEEHGSRIAFFQDEEESEREFNEKEEANKMSHSNRH